MSYIFSGYTAHEPHAHNDPNEGVLQLSYFDRNPNNKTYIQYLKRKWYLKKSVTDKQC